MSLIMSMSMDKQAEYLFRQLDNIFPDNEYGMSRDAALSLVKSIMPKVMDRVEKCIGSINISIYHDDIGNTVFSHLHADAYATFLYYLSNTLWTDKKEKVLCDKIMYLNRALNGFFVSYKCELPDHFYLSHPVGTVLGNAEYGDFLVVHQNVTINTGLDANNKRLKIGKGCFLSAGCSVIGNETIGDYVSLGVRAFVFNQEIPNDSVVKAENGNLCMIDKRKNPVCRAQRDFDIDF